MKTVKKTERHWIFFSFSKIQNFFFFFFLKKENLNTKAISILKSFLVLQKEKKNVRPQTISYHLTVYNYLTINGSDFC